MPGDVFIVASIFHYNSSGRWYRIKYNIKDLIQVAAFRCHFFRYLICAVLCTGGANRYDRKQLQPEVAAMTG